MYVILKNKATGEVFVKQQYISPVFFKRAIYK